MNDFWQGYFTASALIFIVSIGTTLLFPEKEPVAKCIINTHLTPEQFTEAVGIEAELFGVSNGDVLALVDCK